MYKVRRISLNASDLSLISGAALTVNSLGRDVDSDTTEVDTTNKLQAHYCNGCRFSSAMV